MPTTTTNFGWTVPSDTDLVKDGAAAIRTALGGVDTSMVDLKGGTTGQVLSKASNTDMDFTWVAQDDSNAIQNAIVDAKGDIIAASAADTPARLAVGTNGQILTADSTAATGLAWTTPSSGAMTLITSGTLSGASLDLQSITSSYKDLVLDIQNPYGSATMLKLRINNESGATSHGYFYTKVNDGSLYTANSTEMNLGVYSSATNNSTSYVRIMIPKYSSGDHRPVVNWTGTDTVDSRAYWGFGYRINSSDAVNRLTVYMTSQSFSGGNYYLYGVN